MTEEPHDHVEPESQTPPEPDHTERKLRRSSRDSVLAGVCGGMGEYFDVDPVFFRIGWALFALMGGLGVAAYIAAWVIMPEAEGAETSSDTKGKEKRASNLNLILGVGLILLGLNLFLEQMGWRIFPLVHFDLEFDVIIAFGLIGLGAWLVFRKPSDPKEADPNRRRFTRSRTDRQVAGICGGIAEHFKWDPTLVRVGVVVLAFATQFAAAIIYLVMIAVVPEAPLESENDEAEVTA